MEDIITMQEFYLEHLRTAGTEIEPIKLVKTFNFDYENGHAFKETIEYIQKFLKEFPKKN